MIREREINKIASQSQSRYQFISTIKSNKTDRRIKQNLIRKQRKIYNAQRDTYPLGKASGMKRGDKGRTKNTDIVIAKGTAKQSKENI